MVVLGLAMT